MTRLKISMLERVERVKYLLETLFPEKEKKEFITNLERAGVSRGVAYAFLDGKVTLEMDSLWKYSGFSEEQWKWAWKGYGNPEWSSLHVPLPSMEQDCEEIRSFLVFLKKSGKMQEFRNVVLEIVEKNAKYKEILIEVLL